MPHFLAIAWMYRDDYAQACFRMLPGRDPDGMATGRQALGYALCLLPVSLLPAMSGLLGPAYFFGVLALGVGFCWAAAAFAFQRTQQRARTLFLASIAYLPLLMLWLVIAPGPR